MRKGFLFTVVSVLAILPFNSFTQESDFPILKGSYLGQAPPGMNPIIFAPGIISTAKGEFNSLFSPDGNEFYFTVAERGKNCKIMFAKLENKQWTKPRVASFSGVYNDMDPGISADGQTIYFGSSRSNDNTKKEGCDIWEVVRKPKGLWSEPRNIGEPVNSTKNENYPTKTKNGTLYFQSNGHSGSGGLDIFRSEYTNGKHSEPENLGSNINSEYNDFDAFIARDESYLIFSSSNRPGGFGSGDLYIGFKNRDGSWTKAQNMGSTINSSEIEYCPQISPDGKYFFFTSGRSGNGDIYWVDGGFIEKLKREALK